MVSIWPHWEGLLAIQPLMDLGTMDKGHGGPGLQDLDIKMHVATQQVAVELSTLGYLSFK